MIGDGDRRPSRRAMWACVAGCAGLAAMSVVSCAHKAPLPSDKAKPIVAAVLPAVRVEAKAEFEAGVRLAKLGKKHHAEARAHLVRATELDAKFFEAWHNLGWLDAKRGNFGRAASAFRRALEIQPGSRATALALGESWRRAGSFKKAAQLYGERLSAAPKDAELRNRYIQVLRDSGDLQQALAQTKIALGQAGEDVAQTVFAYNSLGLIYYKMQKLELAETALRKAVELDGNSAFVWNSLGLVAFAHGRDQEAFLSFQKATELDPKYVEARLNKAVVYLDCGDYKHARAELTKAVDASPNDPDAYVALGVAARGEGKIEDARRAYEKALEIEPEHGAALYDLGILFMDFARDPAQAEDCFRQFVEVVDEEHPKRKDALARLKELKSSANPVKEKEKQKS